MQAITPKSCLHPADTSFFLMKKCEHVSLINVFCFVFVFVFRTIAVRAKLLDVEWGTEMGGGSAQDEMLPLEDMDQGHPGVGWGKMHRK